MLIARINLDLGIRKAEFEKETRRLKQKGIRPIKGTTHRYFVRETFRNDASGYLERLSGLVSHATKAGAEIIQLPATSILYNAKGFTIEDYCYAFPKATYVVAGLLNVNRLGYKGDKKEGSVVFHRKKVLTSFPTDHDSMSACAGWLGDLPTIVAVSSTVGDVRSNRDQWFEKDTMGDHRLLVLDLGHEQYTGRYSLTLKSVHAHLRKRWGINPAVVLAQWRYSGHSGSYDWFVGNGSVRRLDLVNKPHDKVSDEVDMIKLPNW